MRVHQRPPRPWTSRKAVVLMTGDARAEEARKNLPRRFLGTLHAALLEAIRAARGIDLIVASDHGEEFRLTSGTRVHTARCVDLAARLHTAFDTARSWGYERIVVVAGDVASLDSRSFERAFEALSSTDCVFAPSSDGGFSLVGLHERDGIEWRRVPMFTSGAADGLRREIRRSNMSWVELPDVDDVDDRHGARRVARTRTITRRLRTTLLGLMGPAPERFDRPTALSAPAEGVLRLRSPPCGSSR